MPTTTTLSEKETDVLKAIKAIGRPATTHEIKGRLGRLATYQKTYRLLCRLHKKFGLVSRETIQVREGLYLTPRVLWRIKQKAQKYCT